MLPVSDMTIWRWERNRGFPRHISIHGRNYWIFGDVQRWLDDRKREGGGAGVSG
jgi:predicted DNA-binding transcriptional regulator AlpA